MEKREEEERSEAFRILDRIEKGVKSDPQLQEAYNDMLQSVKNYFERVQSQAHRQKPEGERLGPQEAEESDHLRKIAHDALIDRLNVLSRMFVEKGIEPEWRKSWGSIGSLGERKAITRWVEEIAPTLGEKQSA